MEGVNAPISLKKAQPFVRMMGRKILRSKILLIIHAHHFPMQGRRIQRGHLCPERTGKCFILTCSVITHKRKFSKVSVPY